MISTQSVSSSCRHLDDESSRVESRRDETRMTSTTFQPRKSARATLTHVICVTENIPEKTVGVSRHLFGQAPRRQSRRALIPLGTPIANRRVGKNQVQASTGLDARAHRRRKCHDAWLNFRFRCVIRVELIVHVRKVVRSACVVVWSRSWVCLVVKCFEYGIN